MSIVVVGTVGYDDVETTRGAVRDALGGSAAYFALAARFFSPVSIVAAVGSDFSSDHHRLLAERAIDLRGLERHEGRTFRWKARYHADMNRRETLSLELNVFARFSPTLLPDQRRSDYLFLANVSPELQTRVLKQVASPKVVGADTMNHWIENEREGLLRLMKQLTILMLNDDEARMLTGEHNLAKAGRALVKMGPQAVVIKRGEAGVLHFSEAGVFAAPAYPVEEVVDPTGAGDTFAGAFMGYIARMGKVNEAVRRAAVVYGNVVASFVVESFSLQRMSALSWEDIAERHRAYNELTDSQPPRWTSP
jgi:sugar/nucleoside kinase (ribokinase family)